MYGFGVRCYLSFDWNRFDFFLVLCGMGEVTISPYLPISPHISSVSPYISSCSAAWAR